MSYLRFDGLVKIHAQCFDRPVTHKRQTLIADCISLTSESDHPDGWIVNKLRVFVTPAVPFDLFLPEEMNS